MTRTRALGLVEALGAIPIDYRNEDVAATIQRAAPEGVDAVFDGLGSASWRRALPLLRPGGRMVIYGMSGAFKGGRRSIPRLVRSFIRIPRTSYLNYVTRGIGVVGYSSDDIVPAHHDWYRRDLAHLIGLLDGGVISPPIYRSYPLDQAGQAHADLGAGRATGKIVLDPGA